MSTDFRGSTDQIPRGVFTTPSTQEIKEEKFAQKGEEVPGEEPIVVKENFAVRKKKGRFKARDTATVTGAAQAAATGEIPAWRTQGVVDGAQSMQDFVVNPNSATAAEFEKRLNALQQEFPHGNIMDILTLLFIESIKDMNEDKKYFLKRLQEFNNMAEGLAAYLQDVLMPASDQLGNKIANAHEDKARKQGVYVELREYDLSSLDSDGNLVEKKISKTLGKKTSEKDYAFYRVDKWFANNTYTSQKADKVGADGKVERWLNQNALSNRIKGLEADQETVRNKRQMASTAFQNFDQKTNQLYNLLSSVLKALGEMRMGTTRNML